jgi:hypothetical protein
MAAAADKYKNILVAFMSHEDGVEYDKHHVFVQQELSNITPDDLVRWMCLKAYGTAVPAEGDNPIHGRSSSLEHYKKAISSFIPNKHMAWNVMVNVERTRAKEEGP